MQKFKLALLFIPLLLIVSACVSTSPSNQPIDFPNLPYLIDMDRQADEVLNIWPKNMLDGEKVTVEERIRFNKNKLGLQSRVAMNITTPKLSFFKAANPNGSSLLIIPGGGYGVVSLDNEGLEGARYFSQQGFDTYVLTYRLPHQGWKAGSDTPMQDAQRAIRLIRLRNHSKQKTSPIVVMGFSAGGHLAGSLTQRFDEETYQPIDKADELTARPDLSVLVYPITLLSEPYAHKGSRRHLIGITPSPEAYAKYDLTTKPNTASPPVILIHAADDAGVPVENSLQLYAAYRKAGVKAALHIFESGGHGFGLRTPSSKPFSAWPILVMEWAKQHIPLENTSTLQ